MKPSAKGQKAGKSAAPTASELFPGGVPSKAWKEGRRVKLFFDGGDKPELDRIEFHADSGQKVKYGFLQRGHEEKDYSFRWTEMPQALSLFFLEYLNAGRDGKLFLFRGTDQTDTLADAVSKSNGKLYILFREYLPNGEPVDRVEKIFDGENIHGRTDRPRSVFVKVDYLPHDCIEILFEGKPLAPQRLGKFIEYFRKAWKLPPPSEPEFLAGEGSLPEEPLPANPPEPTPQPTPAKEAPSPKDKEAAPDTNAAAGGAASQTAPQPEEEKTAPIPPIDPSLFEIHNPRQLCWDDSQPLLDFGEDGSEDDLWRLADACEGVLIFGAPSSGKTSGSGYKFAQAFLAAGFGGLVMTAKTDEAQRWVRRCARAGRAEDCVLMTVNGPHKLNVLAYESQRPRKQIGLTGDLISFFRILIAVVSKRAASGAMEEFWINATDQLMRNLFDVFLLAGEPLTIDSLIKFVTVAPQKKVVEWQKIPFFNSLLLRADKAATSPEDRRIYKSCLGYWTVNYPGIANATRSGITTGFTAMANVLSGRGIHELISSETTLTPESILSGKIVILDLSLKDCGQGGLLIQAAWKYLLQRAIERRSDKGLDTARPVFIWEDEGHMFYSKHDIDFQPTARDCRAAHVIISQSLHNFYQLGHSQDAVLGVFATMNTQVFHANGDLETNKWASEKIGTEITTLVDVSISQEPKKENQPRHWFWDMGRPRETEPKSSTSVKQQRDKVIQPEQFAMLKKGGDGFCEAVVSWLSHPFKANKGRPFCLKVFEQEDKE